MTDKRDEYEDRLVDLALSEKLSERQPPDLSERILSATDEPVDNSADPSRTKRTWRKRLTLLALAASLLAAAVGVGAGIRYWGQRTQQTIAMGEAAPTVEGVVQDDDPSSSARTRMTLDSRDDREGVQEKRPRNLSEELMESDEGAFLREVQEAEELGTHRRLSEVDTVLNEARERMGVDPDGAQRELKLLLEAVERSTDLDQEVQNRLRTETQSAIREAGRIELLLERKRAALESNRAAAVDRTHALSGEFLRGLDEQVSAEDAENTQWGLATRHELRELDVRLAQQTIEAPFDHVPPTIDQVVEAFDRKRVFDKMGLDLSEPSPSPPKLDAIVTAVGERNLIEISVGSDDGLRVGHRLEVFHENAYLGYAVVLKTDPDRSVAQIDEKSQRAPVQVRDQVATRRPVTQPRKRTLGGRRPKTSSEASGARRSHVAVVTAVGDRNLIEISIGSDDGLHIGHRLHVYRNNVYLGSVVVLKTDPDRSVAQINEETQRGPVQVRDQVTATLPRTSPKPKRTWRRAKASPNATRLIVGEKDELLLEGVQANVVVDGFRARVVLDYYFYNDRDRQLEGTFKLRLPNEASLYYFAFGETVYEYRPQVDQLASAGFLNADLLRATHNLPDDILKARGESWSRVKEARVVPREKASYAYAETTRQRVDPALVEWSGAGMFNAKVFPLAPGKLHRIVVGYDVNLQHDDPDLVYKLELPDDRGQCVVDMSVAALPGIEAQVTPATKPFTSGGRAYYHFKDPETDSIQLRLHEPGALMLVGQDPQAGDLFAAEVKPSLNAGEEVAGTSQAVFLLDTSLSSNPDRFNVWLALLKNVLDRNRDTLKQFAVLEFNVETHWWQDGFADNTPDNVTQFMDYAHTLVLEGATDLEQALREATSPTWAKQESPNADLFLLGDGAVTWGESNLHLITKSLNGNFAGSLFAYKTGTTGTATDVLEYLARQTGGAVFSVATEEEVVTAATAHRRRPWRLLHASASGGTDVLVAGRPRNIYPGQRLLIVGRGRLGTDSEVTLHMRRGEDDRHMRIPLDRVVQSDLTPRIYGQVAVGQLEDLAAATEEVSVAYARHFRVTGQTCSLLMLESEQNYRRFDIKPEDDAFVVKSSRADEVILKTFDEVAERLGDPKQSLLDWLTKLERLRGVEFKASTAFRLAIEHMPPDAFDVKTPRLECKLRRRDQLPKAFQKTLSTNGDANEPLDYDVFAAEAERRLAKYGGPDALKAMSSLVESNPGDMVLARDVAFSAIQWGLGGQAYPLLCRVARARPYQPQTYQAIGRCLAELGHADLAMVYYEIAFSGHWDRRFRDFNRIVAVEYLHLLQRICAGELESHAADYAKARCEALANEFDMAAADLVITITWNTDRTDVDLHVVEPSGEECDYQHRETKSGGHLTEDVTEGFGPEMYVLQQAPRGKYAAKVHYFGSDSNRTSTRTKVYLTIYEDFSTNRERVTHHVVTLGDRDETRQVAVIGRK